MNPLTNTHSKSGERVRNISPHRKLVSVSRY